MIFFSFCLLFLALETSVHSFQETYPPLFPEAFCKYPPAVSLAFAWNDHSSLTLVLSLSLMQRIQPFQVTVLAHFLFGAAYLHWNKAG